MSVPPNIAPGPKTIKWMLDVQNAPGVPQLRISQLAAFALQPRFGTLAGASPQPTDAEYIVNRLSFDNVTGVVRIQVPRETPTADVGAAILAAVRQAIPNAQPHVAAANAGTAFFPALGFFATAAQRIAPDRVSASLGSVVIDIQEGIDNTTRPAAGSNPVARALNQTSERVSTDPARNGTVGAATVNELATTAFNPPWWLIATAISAGVLITGVVGYAVYVRVSGK